MAVPARLRPQVLRFNRVARRFAVRLPPFAVVHAVGRRTGRRYETPVVAFAGYVDGVRLVATPLAWGRDAGWCRNVRAAGRYSLTRRGREYRVDELRVVDRADAVPVVGGGARFANAVVRPREWIVGRLRAGPAA